MIERRCDVQHSVYVHANRAPRPLDESRASLAGVSGPHYLQNGDGDMLSENHRQQRTGDQHPDVRAIFRRRGKPAKHDSLSRPAPTTAGLHFPWPYFRKKMGVVWPLIVDQTLIHLTPHMFPCHRSHSWIYGGDHFLVKNP